MKVPAVKRSVHTFLRDYRLEDVTVQDLLAIFENQGFIVLEFNPVIQVNDPDIQTVISSLKLEEMIVRSSGFLYLDSHYRLVFVNEKLSEREKLLVLAHEEAHFYLGHASQSPTVGRDVLEEYEANEFVHYLLFPSSRRTLKKIWRRFRPLILIALLLVGLALGGSLTAKKQVERTLYEGEFYVTEHGKRYHRKGCVTIQGRAVRRLTKEDALSGNYEPCSVCQPDS